MNEPLLLFLTSLTFISLYFSNNLFTVQTNLMDGEVKLGLLGVWMALFVVFAARKFTQPIKVLPKMIYCPSPTFTLINSPRGRLK